MLEWIQVKQSDKFSVSSQNTFGPAVSSSAIVKGPWNSRERQKERLERMFNKATQVRETYQDHLCNLGQLTDQDFVRSLEEWETAKIHNAWMNDVASWMTDEALAQYNEFLRLAQELEEAKGKGKQRGKAGKSKGSAGKPAMGGGKMGTRQQAQEFKQQQFNNIFTNFAANKALFFLLVKHPHIVEELKTQRGDRE